MSNTTNKNSQSYLEARAIIAGDLFREGKIPREECFRIEMDAALGRNTGDIRYCPNDDYEKGWM